MATPEEQFDQAERSYHAAARALEGATLTLVAQRVSDHFPAAATLVAHGEMNEDSNLVLRVQRVLGADGGVLYDVEDPTEEDEGFIDEVESDLLCWLIELDEDDYRGDQVIPVAAEPAQ